MAFLKSLFGLGKVATESKNLAPAGETAVKDAALETKPALAHAAETPKLGPDGKPLAETVPPKTDWWGIGNKIGIGAGVAGVPLTAYQAYQMVHSPSSAKTPAAMPAGSAYGPPTIPQQQMPGVVSSPATLAAQTAQVNAMGLSGPELAAISQIGVPAATHFPTISGPTAI